ncbi:MAG TPA: prephenate dehydrogenase/arogenate dehydrogenase family protein, partial [bacterium]|nr:prephenate dehydrogenase/arogenate dehydrogenase family protein [bacterium]
CEFWKLLKCNVKIIDAEFHDLIVGYISHLPHITAAALVNTAALQKKNCVEPLSFAGGGFRDTTRIAASNAELWADILVNNKKVINQAIADMIENLKQFQNALDKNNKDKLIDIFQSAKTNREAIPQHLKDLISITYELIVNVPDKPGILGKLTTLLGDNNINIKHIEVLFVRDDERGAIKLGFKDAETATKGYKLLLANNYIVSKK